MSKSFSYLGGEGKRVSDDDDVSQQNMVFLKSSSPPTGGGYVQEIIGYGEEAKHSIVWIFIRWSLFIPSVITLVIFVILFVFLFVPFSSHGLDGGVAIDKFFDHILKVWSVFTPLLTLVFGYLFGKNSPS